MGDSTNYNDSDPEDNGQASEDPKENPCQEPDPTADPESYLHQYPDLATEIKGLFQGISMLPGEGNRANHSLAETPPESSGYVIDDFRIIREIDSGGMGRVYEAEQISLHRRVALKVLFPHLSLSEKAVRMFQREAEAGSRLIHPGIVSVYAIGKHKGVHYIAQELVGYGVTLADELDRFKEMDALPRNYFKETASLVASVAEALSCMHDVNVIHRDIKPTNILITPEGLPKITDFGLARLEDSLAITHTHNSSGTPYYMSPEQSSPSLEPLDHRTDIFSLGVTLYESLTLERPFKGGSSREVQAKIRFLPARDPRKIMKQVPPDLVLICAKAMEKDRVLRYRSMTDFAEDLQRFVRGEPVRARRAGMIYSLTRWIQRHKLMSITAGAITIAALLIMILTYTNTQRQARLDALLEKQYVPIRLALGWDDLDSVGLPWLWCRYADPGSPGSYMLNALFCVDTGALLTAIACLKDCIERCEAREEPALEQDATYLLCMLQQQLADIEEDPARKGALLEEADALKRTLVTADPYSQHTLIRRLYDSDAQRRFNTGNYLQAVMLNVDHYLIYLYQAVYRFQVLYKGGERGAFEKAIAYFEQVLESRPDHVPSLALLGRVKFFFARCYHYFHLFGEAENHLKRALALSGDSPYHLIYSTLGQIECYRNNFIVAEEYFQKALQLDVGKDKHVHNAITGLARLRMLQGRLEEARDHYLKSLELMHFDSHTHSGLAEVCLKEHKFTEALEYAQSANLNWDGVTKRANLIMRPHLIALRIHTYTKDYEGMLVDLQSMQRASIHSPVHMATACFLIASLPDDAEIPQKASFVLYAGTLAGTAAFLTHDSPVSLSAKGAFAFLGHNHDDAESYLLQAIEARKQWDVSFSTYKSNENVRDLYFLAMTYHARSGADDRTQEECTKDLQLARSTLERAEKIYKKNCSPFLEYTDILDRIRAKAMERMANSE